MGPRKDSFMTMTRTAACGIFITVLAASPVHALGAPTAPVERSASARTRHAAPSTHHRASGRRARRPAAAKPSRVAALATSAAGMRVARDPETGLVTRPTPEQSRALAERTPIAFDHSFVGLTESRLADGTRIVYVGGRFMDDAVASLDSNGVVRIGCVPTRDRAAQASKNAMPAPRERAEQ
jgi:hypothetical protein